MFTIQATDSKHPPSLSHDPIRVRTAECHLAATVHHEVLMAPEFHLKLVARDTALAVRPPDVPP
jgi:hypothetical protein